MSGEERTGAESDPAEADVAEADVAEGAEEPSQAPAPGEAAPEELPAEAIEETEAEAEAGEEEEAAAPAPAGPARRPRMSADRGEMEAALEAVLFVSSEPVPRGKLLDLFDEGDREEAEAALAAVLARYGEGVRGVMVEEVAGGVRLVTRPEMVAWLRRFFEVAGGSKLSMAALETLAIIAYRQPVTGPEIQELRSVSPAGVIKTLLERRLVRIAGRKEVVGKPFLYCTTREFLVHFGLKSLGDLPPLEEFEETFGADDAPAAAPAAVPGGDAEERFLREVADLEEREEEAGELDRVGSTVGPGE